MVNPSILEYAQPQSIQLQLLDQTAHTLSQHVLFAFVFAEEHSQLGKVSAAYSQPLPVESYSAIVEFQSLEQLSEADEQFCDEHRVIRILATRSVLYKVVHHHEHK